MLDNTERCSVRVVMNLHRYYLHQSPDARVRFAEAIGTTPLYYRNVAHGFRRASGALALLIERESHGEVSIAELRPDFAEVLSSSGYRKLRTAKVA